MLLQVLCIILYPLVNSNLSYSPETLNSGQNPKQHQAIYIISSSYVNSNWSYSPKTAKLGCDLCELDLWSLTLTFCMDITLVRGDNFMMIRWWEHSQRGVTDRQTDRQTDRKYHSQGCFVAAKNAKAGACNFSKHSSASFYNMTCQMSQTTIPGSWLYNHSETKQSGTSLWDMQWWREDINSLWYCCHA